MTRKRQWKPVIADWQEVRSQTDPAEVAYCFTLQQTQILKALLIPGYWATRWENLDVSQTELQQIMAEIDSRLDLGCSLILNCDDVENCVEAAPQTTINNTVEITLMLALNLSVALFRAGEYDGTPGSINPDAPTTTFNDDALRDTALCMAAQNFVASWATIKIHTLETVLFGLYGALVLSVVISGGLLLGMAVGVVATGIYTAQVALLALKDQQAIEDVACCMYKGLQGLAVSQANFETALDSCGFSGGTNEQIVRDLIADTIDELDNWTAFIEALGVQFLVAEQGFGNCMCDEWTFNITDFGSVPNVIDSGIVDSEGAIVAGEIEGNDGGSGTSVRAQWFLEMGNQFRVTKAVLVYSCDKRSDIDSFVTVDVEAGAVDDTIIDVDIPAEGDNLDITGNGDGTGSEVRLRFDTGLSVVGGGQVTIESLELSGTGFNPFV